MSKNNSKLAQKLQSDIDSSKPNIITNDDNMSFLKKKYGNKFNEDISDSEDDLTSLRSMRNKPVKNTQEKETKENKEKKQVEYSQNFKNMVIQYIKSDDKIREHQEQIKNLRNKKKEAEDFILRDLENYDEKAIAVGGSLLRKNEHESKSALKQDIIKETLMKKIGDAVEVQKLINMMEENRKITTRVSLKRIIEK